MKAEEYQRLICRMNEIPPEADAAVLVVVKGDDVVVTTAGEPNPLTRLKGWMYKWLGGREA